MNNQRVLPRTLTVDGHRIRRVRNIKIDISHDAANVVTVEMVVDSVEIDEGGNVSVVSIAPEQN